MSTSWQGARAGVGKNIPHREDSICKTPQARRVFKALKEEGWKRRGAVVSAVRSHWHLGLVTAA